MNAPTNYADLNAILAELVSGARDVLGENFCGAYLQGSFAVGDADEYSDVDFLVVIHREITSDEAIGLEALHKRLSALKSSWAQHLEGSYVPKERLRRVDSAREPWFYLDNGATEFQWDNHDNTAVVRWSLREHGVVLAGPDPKAIVEPISEDDLRADVLTAVNDWQEWLSNLSRWSARLQPLVVLSYCRILHTLETGTVSSKREAGEWASRSLEPQWRDLIRRALADRADPWTKVRRPAKREAVDWTLAFAAYASDLARSLGEPRRSPR